MQGHWQRNSINTGFPWFLQHFAFLLTHLTLPEIKDFNALERVAFNCIQNASGFAFEAQPRGSET